VGVNWGWQLAFAIIVQEITGEKKYGINTTGADELKELKKSGIDISHATIYMPVSYRLMEQTMEQLATATKKHFIDIGCGKGRALAIAASYGFNKVTGIDFSAFFCNETAANLKCLQKKISALEFTVLHQDAATYTIPADADCIFLFNPFDKIIMQKVVDNIAKSLHHYPRTMHVIYANPLYKELFIQEGFSQIYYSKTMQQFEVAVLKSRC
jgi:SAM-dependent methyltransferase